MNNEIWEQYLKTKHNVAFEFNLHSLKQMYNILIISAPYIFNSLCVHDSKRKLINILVVGHKNCFIVITHILMITIKSILI